MLKRTKGRLLLTLLVVTGFAGTLNNTSLTKKERNFVVGHLKQTKNELLKSINGLSEKQLNFKRSADQWSIKESFYHLAQAENGFWEILETTMKEPTDLENCPHLKISDKDLLNGAADRAAKAKDEQAFLPGNVRWQSINGAISAFKALRLQSLKYTKTTTEDLRNHFIQLGIGWVDGYQFILYISEYSRRYLQEISEIKADPDFPKK
ncbi:MAG: DinB family protein [Chitinophagaceae bacterium]